MDCRFVNLFIKGYICQILLITLNYEKTQLEVHLQWQSSTQECHVLGHEIPGCTARK